MSSLDQNRIEYDRQLYGDWIVKVFEKCQNACVFRPKNFEKREGGLGPQNLFDEDGLKEREKQCGRNCIRKYERTYKMYENGRAQLMEEYMKDEDIDPEYIQKNFEEKQKQSMAEDQQEALKFAMAQENPQEKRL